MVKKFFIVSGFFLVAIVPFTVHAQWVSPTVAPPGGNPPPPVWIQTASPGTTQPGNIHIGNKAIIDGDIQIGGNGTVTGTLGLGGAPDTSLGRKLDVQSSGAWGAVVRNGSAVALGIAPSVIGTITNHPLQIWTNNAVRMLVGDTGNVGINQLLPAHRLDVGGDINTSGAYRAGGTAGITLAATCAAGDVLKGVNVKSGIITAGACASDNVGGGGGGGTVTSVTGTAPISVATGTTTPVISLSGTVGLANGGTGANLSATGGAGHYVKQTAVGGIFSVGAIAASDIPAGSGNYIQNQTAEVQSAGFNVSGNGFVEGNVGIGTTSTFGAKLVVQYAPGALGVVFHNGTSGLKFINPATGPELGTYTGHPLALFTNDTKRMVITGNIGVLPGRVGIGANPAGAPDVNARLVVCRMGDIASDTLCTIPTNTATVVVLGSADNTTGASSMRARGVIEAQGGFRTPAGGSIQSGMSDIGEYVRVEGLARDYRAGDIVVISSRPNTFTKSTVPYATNVAGIITTTAGYIGGVTDTGDAPSASHVIMALAGQVSAYASAENGSIAVGDLLTTSSTPGTLMKCVLTTPASKVRCMGAVVAKALQPLPNGVGSINVLATLQ